MKKFILIIFVFFVISPSISKAEKLELKRSFWKGTTYVYQGKENTLGFLGKNLKEVVKDNPKSLEEMKKYGTYHGIASVLAYGGAAAIGWALGGDFEAELFAGGVASAGFGILLEYTVSEKHLKKAVDIYNKSIKSSLIDQVYVGLLNLPDKVNSTFLEINVKF